MLYKFWRNNLLSKSFPFLNKKKFFSFLLSFLFRDGFWFSLFSLVALVLATGFMLKKLRSSSHDMFLKSLLVGERERSLRGIQSYFFFRRGYFLGRHWQKKGVLSLFHVEVKNLSLASWQNCLQKKYFYFFLWDGNNCWSASSWFFSYSEQGRKKRQDEKRREFLKNKISDEPCWIFQTPGRESRNEVIMMDVLK